LAGSRQHDPAAILETERCFVRGMILGLVKGVAAMSAEHGIAHLGAVLTPALLRHMARFGVSLDPVGPLVDYHGLRQAAVCNAGRMLARIEARRPAIWEFFVDGELPRSYGRQEAA